MGQPPVNSPPLPTRAESQLDAILSRIQALTDNDASGPEASRQQPRRAADAPPPVRPATAGDDHQNPAGFNAVAASAPISSLQPTSRAAPFAPTVPSTPTELTRPRPSSPQPGAAATPVSAVPPNPLKQPAFSSRIAELPLGFVATRDEPWRPAEPRDIASAGINETLLEAIIYRYLQNIGEASGRQVADQVKLPFRMIEPLLTRLKMEQNVAYKNATSTNDYVYILTETGRAIARNHIGDCTYYGACPVPLRDYIDSVKLQTIEGQYPKKNDLLRAFSDLLINPKMLHKLGPAVASGRGMFLFGYPGNGKTSIAERVTGAFGKYIWVPRAIDVDGDVLRVFDPMSHTFAMPQSEGSGLLDISGFDKRWVRILRPTIVAGGELTMDMLEVQHNRASNISESPLQLKSNCGTLVIDDFGRQKMPVDALLNRWIVPLEKRYDFLNMASGKKIQVPFDQLVVFSTNLEPKDLVDDAFLRRIPYKIEAENPPEADFRKLFEIMCKVTKVPYNAEAIDYLIATHYKPIDRPMRMCQPRDLLLQVKNFCLYNDLPIELKNEYFDFACDNYFSVM